MKAIIDGKKYEVMIIENVSVNKVLDKSGILWYNRVIVK